MAFHLTNVIARTRSLAAAARGKPQAGQARALEAFSLPYRVHIGCDVIKLEGFVNVDVRETSATDVVHDCGDLSVFPDDSAEIVFSHAFFEHVYRAQQVPLLTDIRRVLQPSGCVFFAGIPDFEEVARCYLDQSQGNVSPTFDLFEVYRYTHGDPEQHPDWWLEQLHKSLFDQRELETLLSKAGFTNPCIFRYAYDKEPNKTNLAFLAMKDNRAVPEDFLQAQVERFSSIYRTTEINVLS